MPGLVYLPPLFLTTGIPRHPADARTSDAIDAGRCGALTARIGDDDGIQSFNLGGGVREVFICKPNSHGIALIWWSTGLPVSSIGTSLRIRMLIAAGRECPCSRPTSRRL